MVCGVSDALLWGLVAGSSFVVGGALALRIGLTARTVGMLMGFGSGALIAAVAYELVDEADRLSGGTGHVGSGLVLGSVVYLAATARWHLEPPDGRTSGRLEALPVAAIVIPEAVVVVGSLLNDHLSVAVILAVFLCGVPEGFVVTGRLRAAGRSSRQVMLVWATLMLVCGIAAALVYAWLDGARPGTVAFVLALAGGAVLTELTTELVPEGYERAGSRMGIAVVVGFAMVFALADVG
jgi:ZIP family zinc transporter